MKANHDNKAFETNLENKEEKARPDKQDSRGLNQYTAKHPDKKDLESAELEQPLEEQEPADAQQVQDRYEDQNENRKQ
jgi:hypothetical protein